MALAALVVSLLPACHGTKQTSGELPGPLMHIPRSGAERSYSQRRVAEAPVRRGPLAGGYDGGIPAAWQPKAPARAWDAIVIHHSASPSGSAAAFNQAHLARGWDGLGYHFVIGNGNGSPDGAVEVGFRWTQQRWGAHCKTPSNHYNDYGIGICLVGNFNETTPTMAQMASLQRLVSYLANEYRIPPSQVLGHREVAGTHTECPGANFNMPRFRAALGQKAFLAAGTSPW